MVKDGGRWQRQDGKRLNFGFGIYKGVFGMTRREEIVNNIGYQMTIAKIEYIEKHEFADAMDAFEAGAEWMQKKMIDRACEWLRNNWREYINQDGDGVVHFSHWESDFRKEMEE